MKTPVVLIIFKRPNTTKKVFEAIRKAKPSKLFVIADGPRKNRPDEAELCTQTRSVIDSVDWDCEVFKNYSPTNMGLKERIGATGLTWVFEVVEEAIILEDDCLPNPTFFRFCQDLLEKYREDKRIVSISGTNLLVDWKPELQSYHFSYFFSSWGWATWRRVWQAYDVDLKSWASSEMQTRVRDTISHKGQYLVYKDVFDRLYAKGIDSWAYQMMYLGLTQSGLTVVPSKNLISNIGFNKKATNTSDIKDVRANMVAHSMQFPLKVPIGVGADREFERRRYFKLHNRSFAAKISRKLKYFEGIREG